MRDATGMVFCLQELCDQISHHIALHSSSLSDLLVESTALVCQTLCSSVQSQIFRHVGLDPWVQNVFHDSNSALAVATPPLCAFLLFSPLHLTSCATFVISKIRINSYDGPWPDDKIYWLHRRTGWSSGLSLDLFASLFENRPRHMHAFAFAWVWPTSVLPTQSRLRPSEGRAQIIRLQLRGTARLEISSACPVDSTHLIEFETDATKKQSGLLQVLASARLSITRLHITGDFVLLVNLLEYPALMYLELSGAHHEVIASIKPENCIETIVLHVNVGLFESGLVVSDPFLSIEAFITNLSLIRLQPFPFINVFNGKYR
ncbi:hypothetical protein FB451DRAFT_1387955 [Mycena latifolia]|nr:hypothetical protein FB451DRAFT_1387955 [Mycena latifolia]